MPLKDDHPKFWDWRQAVAWIGFNLSYPPPRFNLYDASVAEKITDRGKRRGIAARAVEELLAAVTDKRINEVWRDDNAGDRPSLASERTCGRMTGLLDVKLTLEDDEFRELYFDREAVQAFWTASSSATASAETACRKWLIELASAGTLFEPDKDVGKVLSKREWSGQAQQKFSGLSDRAFDRAWSNVSREYPKMRRAGRKSFQKSAQQINAPK